jgi:hypothetical protein
MHPTTYKIGNIEVTQQAFLVLLAGCSLSIIMFITSIFMLKTNSMKAGGVFASLIIFALSCYASYVINCTIVGKCERLAWVLCLLNVTVFVSYAITFSTMLS